MPPRYSANSPGSGRIVPNWRHWRNSVAINKRDCRWQVRRVAPTGGKRIGPGAPVAIANAGRVCVIMTILPHYPTSLNGDVVPVLQGTQENYVQASASSLVAGRLPLGPCL